MDNIKRKSVLDHKAGPGGPKKLRQADVGERNRATDPAPALQGSKPIRIEGAAAQRFTDEIERLAAARSNASPEAWGRLVERHADALSPEQMLERIQALSPTVDAERMGEMVRGLVAGQGPQCRDKVLAHIVRSAQHLSSAQLGEMVRGLAEALGGARLGAEHRTAILHAILRSGAPPEKMGRMIHGLCWQIGMEWAADIQTLAEHRNQVFDSILAEHMSLSAEQMEESLRSLVHAPLAEDRAMQFFEGVVDSQGRLTSDQLKRMVGAIAKAMGPDRLEAMLDDCFPKLAAGAPAKLAAAIEGIVGALGRDSCGKVVDRILKSAEKLTTAGVGRMVLACGRAVGHDCAGATLAHALSQAEDPGSKRLESMFADWARELGSAQRDSLAQLALGTHATSTPATLGRIFASMLRAFGQERLAERLQAPPPDRLPQPPQDHLAKLMGALLASDGTLSPGQMSGVVYCLAREAGEGCGAAVFKQIIDSRASFTAEKLEKMVAGLLGAVGTAQRDAFLEQIFPAHATSTPEQMGRLVYGLAYRLTPADFDRMMQRILDARGSISSASLAMMCHFAIAAAGQEFGDRARGDIRDKVIDRLLALPEPYSPEGARHISSVIIALVSFVGASHRDAILARIGNACRSSSPLKIAQLVAGLAFGLGVAHAKPVLDAVLQSDWPLTSKQRLEVVREFTVPPSFENAFMEYGRENKAAVREAVLRQVARELKSIGPGRRDKVAEVIGMLAPGYPDEALWRVVAGDCGALDLVPLAERSGRVCAPALRAGMGAVAHFPPSFLESDSFMSEVVQADLFTPDVVLAFMEHVGPEALAETALILAEYDRDVVIASVGKYLERHPDMLTRSGGELLDWVPPRMKSLERCRDAILDYPRALAFVPKHLRLATGDDDLCRLAMDRAEDLADRRAIFRQIPPTRRDEFGPVQDALDPGSDSDVG